MKRIACVLLLSLSSPLAAQEPRPLTEDAAAAMAEFYNRPGTVRLSGQARIPVGSTLTGDVASIGGPLVVAGSIRGDLLVINGDLNVRPGGTIQGSVTVVGGRLQGALDGVAGAVVVYSDPLRFRREGDQLIALGPEPESWLSTGVATSFGRVDLEAAVDGSYNRVEGLPVSFGPRLEIGRSNPTVLDARIIYRTRSGLRIHPDELGHQLRVEQYVGGHRSVRLGLGLHRTIDPIEQNGVIDTENSLSTFILHRDYRDHYSRRGWSAYLVYGERTRPLDLGLEYRNESHGSIRPGEPWSLLDNDEPWRTQPQVAEGDLSTLRGWLRWDTRNDRDDPASGWLIEAEAEQGLEGDLRIATQPPGIPDASTDPSYFRSVGAEYSTFRLDLRRYLRIGPRSRVALRGVFAGSPDDGALPPQRQHVLGGEGTLPGYDRFALDCGARRAALVDDYLPYYGCDRSVLLQGEARFALASAFSLGRLLGLDFEILTAPEVVLFADAGRAWIEEESLRDRLELGPGDLRYDAGVGLRLGRVGFYLAVPFSDEGSDGPNFFVRLGPRI